jgi:hypothetical protein
MDNKAQHPRKASRSRQHDDQPHLDLGALGGVCDCPCPQVLEVRQGTETAPHCQNPQYRLEVANRDCLTINYFDLPNHGKISTSQKDQDDAQK